MIKSLTVDDIIKMSAKLDVAMSEADLEPNPEIAAEGLVIAALNYEVVRRTDGDGSTASSEDALHRAKRALLTSARQYAAVVLLQRAGETDADSDLCESLETAADELLAISAEHDEADAAAREGA